MVTDTVWDLPPHTAGKHKIIEEYLKLWLPILGSWHGNLVMVDGFTGPGEYSGGERGSPLIMLDTALDYCINRNRGRVLCVFVEENSKRYKHLEGLVSKYRTDDRRRMGDRVHIAMKYGRFVDEVGPVVDAIASNRGDSVPSFFMIDPFGIKGAPLDFIRRLLANSRSECLISFMWEPMLRHMNHPSFEPHMDDLFGCSAWRDHMTDKSLAKEPLHRLFEQRLRDVGAAYVLTFELWDGGVHVYTLFFATHGLKGCDVMKQVMWKVDGTGSYSFQASLPGQSSLPFIVSSGGLGDILRQKFGPDWVTLDDVIRFAQGDGTIYHSGQLKTQTLAPMERDGRLEEDRPTDVRRRAFTEGKRIKLRFSGMNLPGF